MATLRNLSVSLLYLNGVKEITRTLQAIARDRNRLLDYLPLRDASLKRLWRPRVYGPGLFLFLYGTLHPGTALVPLIREEDQSEETDDSKQV